MPTNKRRREQAGSVSPPLHASLEGDSHTDPTGSSAAAAVQQLSSAPVPPVTHVGLMRYPLRGTASPNDLRQRLYAAMRHNLMHMQALQEVLRRTSLAEMRDREVYEWLLGTERWLADFHQPLDALTRSQNEGFGSGGGTGSTTGPFAYTSGASSASPAVFPPAVAGDAMTRAYSSALSELRLLVIGVLHTMPWWRVVEGVAKSHASGGTPAPAGLESDGGGRRHASAKAEVCQSSSGGGGGGSSSLRRAGAARGGGGGVAEGYGSAAAVAADRAMAARQAITRWHVRLQVAFERVCLMLIAESQHTVRGVLEVLLKPCQLRPPVRDGARRSIPSDSFIRVLNAVATQYSAHYVLELLQSCIADFMPRQRWAERRHHVACTAVLLYVALEGHTPAYTPRLGNSQSLQRAIELLKSLRYRTEDGGGVSPWRLPHATRSSSLPLGAATSEDSGPDHMGGSGVGGGHGGGESSSATSGRQRDAQHPYARRRQPLAPLLPRDGVLPAGYVSAAIQEGARSAGLGLRQPLLPRPDTEQLIGFPYPAAAAATSDTEGSELGAKIRSGGGGGGGVAHSDSSSAMARRRPRREGEGRASDDDGRAALQANSRDDEGAAAAVVSTNLMDVSVEHNNKLLAHRNTIIRLLLNRLLDVEQTLEPREEEPITTAAPRGMHSSVTSGYSSASPSGLASPATFLLTAAGSPIHGLSTTAAAAAAGCGVAGSGGLFPSAPVYAPQSSAPAGESGAVWSSARSSPAALSPAGVGSPNSSLLLHQHSQHLTAQPPLPFGAGPAQPLERLFSVPSLPYLRILRDCTTLVYGRLADDLRRQQVAGSCGNADWWEEILFFYLTVVTRVERPVYLFYLAPSLAMLNTEDEPVNVLHKLITLVTKGSMPVEQPKSTASGFGAGAGAGAAGGGGGVRPASVASAQPVRLRMAPPTGASRRMVTMEERLRAARHIFPLFRFLSSRLDEASGEGVRRRLLKWTAQELRRLGGGPGGLTLSAHQSLAGPAYTRQRAMPSRESRLALIAFAQCAAISEMLDVDILPAHYHSAPSHSQRGHGGHGESGGSVLAPSAAAAATAATTTTVTGAGREGGSRFTASSATGEAAGSVAAALQPLLARYTLQTEQPEEGNEEESADEDRGGANNSNAEEGRGDSSDSDGRSDSADSASSSSRPARRGRSAGFRNERSATAVGGVDSSAPVPRRRLDLRQMEYEGLLQPMLMANCPWQAWLR